MATGKIRLRNLCFTLLSLALVGGAILTIVTKPSRLTPEEAYAKFLTRDGVAEDQLMDPLILAGEEVIPLVLEGIRDPNMPRRRYAIGFLRNCESEAAIPVLRCILEDVEEKHYFRGDALRALSQIQPQYANEIATRYLNAEGHLGDVARRIANNDESLGKKRTLSDALWGRHY